MRAAWVFWALPADLLHSDRRGGEKGKDVFPKAASYLWQHFWWQTHSADYGVFLLRGLNIPSIKLDFASKKAKNNWKWLFSLLIHYLW